MEEQNTLIILKPDTIQRGYIGKVISRFEQKGLKFIGMKLQQVDKATAEELYSIHKGKPFYSKLMNFITASPALVCCIRGVDAINICRKLMGATFGPNAEPGTIRGDFGSSRSFNLVHGSDSPESAAREIPIFFNDSELLDYDLISKPWIYDLSGEE